jgi:hypothetical protein
MLNKIFEKIRNRPLSSIGYILFIIHIFAPIYIDYDQIWIQTISGFRLFTRSIVFSISIFGGNTNRPAFLACNVFIMLAYPLIIFLPWAKSQKLILGSSVVGVLALISLPLTLRPGEQVDFGLYMAVFALALIIGGHVQGRKLKKGRISIK